MGTAGADETLRTDLVRRAVSLKSRVDELALLHLDGVPTDGFDLVGIGTAAIESGFTKLEPLSRTVMCSVIPVLSFDPWTPAEELNQRSLDRGVELRTVVGRRSVAANPLLASIDPTVRLGHAVTTLYLVDRSLAVLPGPLTHEGLSSVWSSTLPDVLAPALELWDLIWASSRPLLAPGERPPFTERQLQVAILLARGTKDASIARELGVSVRTVVSEVAHLVNTLGATNRVEAVLLLRSGRGRP